MAHQSPYRTGVLLLPILDQFENWHANIGRKWFPKCAKFGTWTYLAPSLQYS